MKNIFFLTILIGLFACTTICAQESSNAAVTKTQTPKQVHPAFPGGMKAFYKYLNDTLGSKGFVSGLEGKIIVTFVVEKNGDLSDIKIKQGIEKELNLAVIQALNKSPFWTPGYEDGKPVRVQYTLPIVF